LTSERLLYYFEHTLNSFQRQVAVEDGHARGKMVIGVSAMKDTRERLIEAADQVLRELGLSHLSTREVARTAGVAEGALYHHFEDKNALLLAVIRRYGADYAEEIRNLPLMVGERTLRENLSEVAWVVYSFHRHAIPITCSLFADTALLTRHRDIVRAKHGGPERTFEALTAYLRAEQRLGRISKKADPDAVALTLVGGCFQIAFLETHWAQKMTRAEARHKTEAVVQALLLGLAL
jgi:AcrR family transcriptional regulator